MVRQIDFMFLVDAMLTPELPCGWLRRASPGMAEGSEYYWNTLLGWAQWEHPQISLCAHRPFMRTYDMIS